MDAHPDLRLTTVFAGPLWRVMLMEISFKAEGIACFVPDRLTKIINPFVTGANALDLRLQVSSEHAEAALAVVAAEAAEERAAPKLDPVEAALFEVDRLGRRICFASLEPFTSPIALWYATPYLRRAAALGTRARGHGYVLAAILIAVPKSLLMLFIILI